MVEIFKSPINIQKESICREIATTESLTIEGNKSASIPITFAHTFSANPFVFYSLICADREFGLSHYISDVRVNGFTVCIENQATIPRAVRIIYEAKAN